MLTPNSPVAINFPEKTINPVHQIAEVLPKIAGLNLDNGDEFFSPSKLVITDIRGGMEVTNVTPDKLNVMFNVRNSTKTTQKDIIILDEKILEMEAERYFIYWKIPF